MGAASSLLTHQDRSDEALINEQGAFSFEGLAAGAVFDPHFARQLTCRFRRQLFVQPGLRTLLNVSMAGLFSSVQLVYPTPISGRS